HPRSLLPRHEALLARIWSESPRCLRACLIAWCSASLPLSAQEPRGCPGPRSFRQTKRCLRNGGGISRSFEGGAERAGWVRRRADRFVEERVHTSARRRRGIQREHEEPARNGGQ